eukprot:7104769-Pyramimonas_sp.AAC.1
MSSPVFEHSAHETHAALHRWNATNVQKWMTKWLHGNISSQDLRMRFVAGLPNVKHQEGDQH